MYFALVNQRYFEIEVINKLSLLLYYWSALKFVFKNRNTFQKERINVFCFSKYGFLHHQNMAKTERKITKKRMLWIFSQKKEKREKTISCKFSKHFCRDGCDEPFTYSAGYFPCISHSKCFWITEHTTWSPAFSGLECFWPTRSNSRRWKVEREKWEYFFLLFTLQHSSSGSNCFSLFIALSLGSGKIFTSLQGW